MTEYIPSTAGVRSDYANYFNDGTEKGVGRRLAKFDRWLELHDREVRAKARREAKDEAADWSLRSREWRG